jgi:hypothetical protein
MMMMLMLMLMMFHSPVSYPSTIASKRGSPSRIQPIRSMRVMA